MARLRSRNSLFWRCGDQLRGGGRQAYWGWMGYLGAALGRYHWDCLEIGLLDSRERYPRDGIQKKLVQSDYGLHQHNIRHTPHADT